MNSRDRRQLKASVEAHRPKPTAPPTLGEKIDAELRVLPKSPAQLATPSHREPRPQPPVDLRPDSRPLSVEYVALRYQEALIRRDGENALHPVAVSRCVEAARQLLREANCG